MARKAEAGIQYFPINTDIIQNPKIKLVVAEFGSKTTWAVLLPIYCKIYREKGYWMDWFDEDSKMLFAQEECKLELSTVNEIVAGCLRRSLFDKRVFELFGVLTSDRIQTNYFEAKKRSKSIVFIKEFGVKNEKNENVHTLYENVNIINLNVNIIAKKVNISTQKEKEIIELEGDKRELRMNSPDLSNSNLFRKPSIPTKHEVWEKFSARGGTKEMAKKFWEKHEGTGWYLNNSPIVNFASLVSSFISNWQKNESNRKQINCDAAAEGIRIQEQRSREILDS